MILDLFLLVMALFCMYKGKRNGKKILIRTGLFLMALNLYVTTYKFL